MSDREDQRERLFGRLCEALAAIGRNDAFGRGEFWIVDDDWGGHHQKIFMAHPSFWSAHLETAVRTVPIDGFPHWGVHVVFDGEPALPGFIVHSDGIAREPRWP